MVARIVCGKNIAGAISYNENKVKLAEAELLLASGFPLEPSALSLKAKLARFESLTCKNAGTKTNTVHVSLNFSCADNLNNDLLCLIAADYMEGIGFGNQPYLVYRHYDAAHPHIHITTVNIDAWGDRIETHNIGRNQSEAARKAIEESYSLVKAEDQKSELTYMLRPARLERADYGKRATKAVLNTIVREVTSTYKFTSLPELNAILRQFNVRAYPGEEGSKQREHNGLVYQVLGDQGLPVGVPIKASAFYGSPTISNLQKRYAQNETERKPYGLRLKHLLDKALGKGAGPAAFAAALRAQGIRILLRENEQNLVYGITFIDNATRSVFNGSDLGKSYSARAFMERLTTAGLWPPAEQVEVIAGKNADPGYPAAERPVIESVIESRRLAAEQTISSGAGRQLKRKKGLQAE